VHYPPTPESLQSRQPGEQPGQYRVQDSVPCRKHTSGSARSIHNCEFTDCTGYLFTHRGWHCGSISRL